MIGAMSELLENTMKDWTTQTLAKAAGVTDSYIRLLLTQGQLRGEKFGYMWLIPYEVGQRWLDERKAEQRGI